MPTSIATKCAFARLFGWALLLLPLLGFSADIAAQTAWADWDRFAARFIQADGRVIDLTFDGKSTSEGQAYGLFFSLVANDRAHFDAILNWTNSNLAGTELGKRLPGWLWGKKDDGSWGLKDQNAAADADLWMAYALLEAGRLWRNQNYDALGHQLLKLIAEQEVVRAGNVTVLLPGPIGFKLSQDRFRINPSYLPGFMFAYLSATDKSGPWRDIWETYLRLAPKIYARGVAPDIVIVSAKGDVMPDSERPPLGSYDAIRVYLWAGMSGEQSAALTRALTPYAKLIGANGKPPEKVNPLDGVAVPNEFSPVGFSGAVLPFLAALNDRSRLNDVRRKVDRDAEEARSGATTHYYDQVLVLFGKGFVDGAYGFDAQGRVVPRWSRG